jgi:large subunit ribosomal protein L4e
MLKIFTNLKVNSAIEASSAKPRIKKGLRRSSKTKHYRRSVLLVISKNGSAIKAARNMAGVDACTVSGITANLLAPGGVPGRTTVWSEQAIKTLEESIKKQSL